jgi:hypothetical protein
MISKRCKRCDLLNHLKQKNIPYQVKYNQIMDKSSSDFYKWEVKLEFDGTHYIEVDLKKKKGLNNLVDRLEEQIYKFLQIS